MDVVVKVGIKLFDLIYESNCGSLFIGVENSEIRSEV